MPEILSGTRILSAGLQSAGGKGYALAELEAAGFRVPRFFILTSEAFRDGKLLPEAIQAVAAYAREIAADAFAVRSSARSEDGLGDSHAGQFLSLLNVAPEDIAAAAENVVASGLQDSVAAYRAARGHNTVELPAVVVQEMVHASSAGVAFSADPVSGRRDRVVISALKGLGDRLVSGLEDGEAWTLSSVKQDVLMRPADAVLTVAQARKVAVLCERVTTLRGGPQDIEWAFGPDGDTLHLLQSRPVTTQLLPQAAPETKLCVFDNSNIVESYPGFVSPLTFSFAAQAYARVYRTFLKMVGVPETVIAAHQSELSNMLSRVDGRMYYNLGNWYRLLSLLPFFSRNQKHMETMMGVSEPLPEEAMQGAPPTPGRIAVLHMVARLAWQAVRLRKTRDKFMQQMAVSVPARGDAGQLAALPLSALASEYRRLETALLDRWDAPIVNDFLCMMAFGGSRKLMQRWAGEAGIAIHNDVMIGQGDIISALPARLIQEAGEIARSDPRYLDILRAEDSDAIFAAGALGEKLKAYVVRFGDRRIGELKLEQPTLDDDASPLFRAVLAAAATPRQPKVHIDAEQAVRDAFLGRPVRRWISSRLLGYAKARVRDRENLRFERTGIFGHARRVFLGMGQALAARGLIDNAQHIFELTVEEALGVAEGSAVNTNLRGLIALRLAEKAEHQASSDPPERFAMRGALQERQRICDSKPAFAISGNPNERNGTACGGGVVRGVACVVADPAREQVKPGEILVARHTDPGWISHFANAAAVIAERGSVLSHSAIVSRELGIPCVVAVHDACKWIASGDMLEVDGSRGIVRKVNG